MSEYRLYKLVNGDEIVGELIEGRHQNYDLGVECVTLRKVRILAVRQVGPGQLAVEPIPYMFGNQDGNIEQPVTGIMSRGEVNSNLEALYIQVTSQIQIANQMPPEQKNGGKIIT